MISRVAENCFWLTRYLERIDTLARLLNVNQAFQLDVELPSAQRWRPLIIVSGAEEDYLERVGEAQINDADRVQEYLTWDAEQPSSIYSSLRWARENARTVRETMSVDMWEAINALWLWMDGSSSRRLYQRERSAFYAHLSQQCMLIHGICYSTMLHDEPFVFMKLGRAAERVGQTARILDVQHHSLGDSPGIRQTATDTALWLAILRSCSGVEPFFERSSSDLSGPAVAAFLIFEPTFPRSIVHNLDRARGLLARLRADDPTGLDRPSWEILESLRAELAAMDMTAVLDRGLHEVLTWIVQASSELCDAIHDDYLDPPVDTLRQVVRSGGGPSQIQSATGGHAGT